MTPFQSPPSISRLNLESESPLQHLSQLSMNTPIQVSMKENSLTTLSNIVTLHEHEFDTPIKIEKEEKKSIHSLSPDSNDIEDEISPLTLILTLSQLPIINLSIKNILSTDHNNIDKLYAVETMLKNYMEQIYSNTLPLQI
jgi:hypothetical protein